MENAVNPLMSRGGGVKRYQENTAKLKYSGQNITKLSLSKMMTSHHVIALLKFSSNTNFSGIVWKPLFALKTTQNGKRNNI